MLKHLFHIILIGALTLFTSQAPGQENIARNRSYTFSAAPNYAHCTDDNDLKDLTDSVRTKENFWITKTTVGWGYIKKPLQITVDLGDVEPISGVTYGTAAGVSSVSWPSSIRIQVSEDGKTFHDCGDLTRLMEKPWPPAYGQQKIFEYDTFSLTTKGRFVRLQVTGTPYIFCDEIKVFRGPDEFLELDYPPRIKETQVNKELKLTRQGCYQRIRRDLETVSAMIAEKQNSVANDLSSQLSALRNALESSSFPSRLEGFKAIVPFNEIHRDVLKLHARLLEESNVKPLTIWHSPPYRVLPLFEKPGEKLSRLQVGMMQNERRCQVFNITNASQQEKQVSFSFEPNDEIFAAKHLTVYQVEHVDTSEGLVVASVLVPVKNRKGNYTTTVPSGMTRQIWLKFDTSQVGSGIYKSKIHLSSIKWSSQLDLQMEVARLRFPDKLDFGFGMWDYVANKIYGITDDNKQAAVEHILSEPLFSGVWSNAIPFLDAGAVDGQGNIIGEIDFSQWDDFVKLWPGKRYYFVFPNYSSNSTFAGKEQGTAAFERAMSQWAARWAEHNRELGLTPGQAAILFLDEPHYPAGMKSNYICGKAVKAGTDEILVLNTSPGRSVDVEYGPEMLSVADIICPTRDQFDQLNSKQRKKYADLVAQGKELWFYMANGRGRLYDPSYYRIQPWHCYAAGATGSQFWAYGPPRTGTCWNPYPAIYEVNYSPVYFGKTTVHTSKHFEAIIEGMQDYGYLKMLEQRVTQLEKSSRKAPPLKKARMLLSNGADDVLKNLRGRFQTNYAIQGTGASSVAEKKRLEILDMLMELEKVELYVEGCEISH